MSYASPADVNARLVGRDLDPDESAVVATRLDDAEELIRERIPDLDHRITSGEIRERLLVMTEAEAVLRLIRNPDGLSQESDGGYSYTLSKAVASGHLEITQEEWSRLGVAATTGTVPTALMGLQRAVLVPWTGDQAVWG